MTSDSHYQIAVIGGGPAGYSAALGCASHGLSTVLVEREEIGGTCLNVGCIPSKALIHAADSFYALRGPSLSEMGIETGSHEIHLASTTAWKDSIVLRLRQGVEGLISRQKVRYIRAAAELIDSRTVLISGPDGNQTLTAEAIVLATGSVPIEMAALPFGGRILSSTDVLALKEVPERVSVIGGGYIGLELGTALQKLGASVTVIEMSEQLLPNFDVRLVRPVAQRLEAIGISVYTKSTALELIDDTLLVDTDNERLRIPTDAVLVTVGRRPLLTGLGLERLPIRISHGAIAVDARGRTSVPGIYAIGDVTGEPMLAHHGIMQAQRLADHLAGKQSKASDPATPSVCFTDPEIFSIGMTSATASDDVALGTATFRANGRALTLGDDAGFVQVTVSRATGALLGMQAVGPGVSELAGLAATALECGATARDLASTMIAHPTLSETISDAARAAA